jgi:RimJ/RimL family protein N-acetyltransferase
MGAIADVWPLYRLRLRSAGTELRWPDEADLAALAELAREPIHDPDVMPFGIPWTDQPEEERARATLQWHWRCRGEWSARDWRLNLVAVRGGVVVGTQGIHAKGFSVTRQVETGSWVGGRYQGKGVGTAMRRCVLHLAFAGLGAGTARSGAFEDNPASLRVSEKLGYARDGTDVLERRGEPATMIRLLLSRASWEEQHRAWPDVAVEGLEACLALFGAENAAPGG